MMIVLAVRAMNMRLINLGIFGFFFFCRHTLASIFSLIGVLEIAWFSASLKKLKIPLIPPAKTLGLSSSSTLGQQTSPMDDNLLVKLTHNIEAYYHNGQ